MWSKTMTASFEQKLGATVETLTALMKMEIIAMCSVMFYNNEE